MISTNRRGLDRLTCKSIFELGTLELAVQTERDSAKGFFHRGPLKEDREREGGPKKTSSEKCSLHYPDTQRPQVQS